MVHHGQRSVMQWSRGTSSSRVLGDRVGKTLLTVLVPSRTILVIPHERVKHNPCHPARETVSPFLRLLPEPPTRIAARQWPRQDIPTQSLVRDDKDCTRRRMTTIACDASSIASSLRAHTIPRRPVFLEISRLQRM